MYLKRIISGFALLFCLGMMARGQQKPFTGTLTPQDTTTVVEILQSAKLEYRRIDSVTELQIMAGNVKLRQGNSYFYCDSCVKNENLGIFEAFGNVHINDNDTTDVYSDYLLYKTETKIAYLKKNVKLTDGKGVLTTNDLEYDLNTKIGTYRNGGKVVNNKTVLTSESGMYYADLKDVYFINNVKLNDPAYYLTSDSLLYNTESETARFIASTFIKDSSGRTITTKEGYYNLKSGNAEFGRRSVINDGSLQVTGDKIYNNDSLGIVQINGNGIVRDTAEDRTVIADNIFVDKKKDAFLATIHPVMIIKQDQDSIFITADTLFSARLTDLFSPVQPDTSAIDSTSVADSLLVTPSADSLDLAGDLRLLREKPADSSNIVKGTDSTGTELNPVLPTPVPKDSLGVPPAILDTLMVKDEQRPPPQEATEEMPEFVREKPKDSTVTDTLKASPKMETDSAAKKDSTNRYFEAYRNVRIFTDSLQAVCDSLFYSFKDSIFRLYQDPVVWSRASQITGDTILLFTKNKKADKMEVFNNSFLANETDPGVYNQVKSRRLDAWFTNGEMDSARARGAAESIYYVQDEDSAYSGINQSESDLVDVYFIKRELKRIVARNNVKGTFWPVRQKSPSEMRLEGLLWLEDKRPKSKFEFFQ